MVKVLNFGIVVSEFELQSRYYVHFRANTPGKGKKKKTTTLLLQVTILKNSYLHSYIVETEFLFNKNILIKITYDQLNIPI